MLHLQQLARKLDVRDIFFLKLCLPHCSLFTVSTPLFNRRHRDQVGSIILRKDSDLSLSDREKGEKNLVPDHAGFY